MKYLIVVVFFLQSVSLFGQIKADSIFSESESMLKTTGGSISGTFTIPNNVNSSPLVLLVAGSGPTDRDCNSTMGIQTNAYKFLAEDFARNGIATLRFDKRGVGKSKLAMSNESDLRFETYVDDVVAWIAMLKADKRFSKIILLGHSEGSLIAMIASQQAEVAGVVSVAGVGRPADKVLQEQLKTKLPMQLMDESDKILDSLRSGKTVTHVNPYLAPLYRPSVQPYMISWIKYDPAKEIAKLKIPVMIIQGTTDLQVTIDDANLLAAAKPDAKLLILDHMNHVLKESDKDVQKNIATYKNPELPLKTGLVEEIVKFITSIQ